MDRMSRISYFLFILCRCKQGRLAERCGYNLKFTVGREQPHLTLR